MKGLILAGGTGTRLRPITYSMTKQLVPVGNKPIILYGLEDLVASGVDEVGIVVAPETGDDIRRLIGDGRAFGTTVTYVTQTAPIGLADAVRTALPFVDGDDVVVYLGDNLVKGGVGTVVDDFRRERPNCQILLCPVDDPTRFGVAELDAHGQVQRLVEKPKVPPSDLALVGVYLFDDQVGEAIESLKPSARGEYEITEAIQYLVDTGRTVRSSLVKSWWKDTGRKDDLLHANELVLADLAEAVEGELIGCTVRGPIRVAAGARLVDCEVTGPAIIGAGAHLTRTRIGPNTAIGERCRLSDAAVEDTIVMEGAEIHGWRIHNSLLGREAVLHGAAPDRFVEMTLGERSEILGE